MLQSKSISLLENTLHQAVQTCVNLNLSCYDLFLEMDFETGTFLVRDEDSRLQVEEVLFECVAPLDRKSKESELKTALRTLLKEMHTAEIFEEDVFEDPFSVVYEGEEEDEELFYRNEEMLLVDPVLMEHLGEDLDLLFEKLFSE